MGILLKFIISLLKILLIVEVHNLHAAKIAGFFPVPSRSHHVLGAALLKELSLRGHDVLLISPFESDEKMVNYRQVLLSDINEVKKETMSKATNPNNTYIEMIFQFHNHTRRMLKAVLDDANMREFLARDEKFDVVIQFYGFNECLLGIGNKLQAKTIAFSPLPGNPWINRLVGNPSNPAYLPNIFVGYSTRMTIIERLANTIASIALDLSHYFFIMPLEEELYREYFPNGPNLYDLIEDVDLALINAHPIIDTPRPNQANAIQIGGFHLQNHGETLDTDLKAFLDDAKRGAIYFSFGSNVDSTSMTAANIECFIKTFSNFPHIKFLWKFDHALENLPDNVRIGKWLPQRAVLEHSNVILFITHSGLGSIVEAIYFGVPMLSIPFFADQYKNSKQSVLNGYAIELNINEISVAILTEAISEVLNNSSYKATVQRFSDIYRNQEMNPMDKAIYWIEHVIKYRNVKYLKSEARNLPLYKYLLLDVALVIGIIVLAIIVLTYYICRLVFRLTKFILFGGKKKVD